MYARRLIAPLLMIAACWPMPAHAQSPAWVDFSNFEYQPTQPAPKPGEITNPILPGMYPDPSILRVGGDFYLVNSTFAFYPGVPIFHSRDLIHWQQIGFVLSRPSQLKLDGLQVSQGIFAPTLRYHDGTFYMITTLIGGIGNFYVTAKNPAGPWSDPIPLPEINGIDPSFFFDDDGSAWIVHNGPPPDNKPLYDGHRAIWLFRFNTVSGKVEGRGRILVNGGVDIAKKPAWIEGPHLFHHEGFYYLIAAEGGTSVNHSEVVFRSKSIDGPFIPYEHNPILTQRDLDPNRTNPIADTGHADLVEDAAGRWWAVFLGVQPYAPDLYNTGRETFLLPVTWKDGWPIILPARQPVPGLVKVPPMPPSPHNSYNAPLVIDLLKQQLDPGSRPFEWESLRTPKSNWFHFDYTSGSISLAARPDDLTSRGNPSFIGRRQQDADFSTSVVVHLPSISVDAGLAAFQNEHTWFFLGIATTANQAPKLFIEQGTGTQAEPRKQVLASLNLPSGTTQVTLKITGQKGQISFWYQAGTAAWQPLVKDADATILSTAKAGGFVGTYLGPYARSQSAAH